MNRTCLIILSLLSIFPVIGISRLAANPIESSLILFSDQDTVKTRQQLFTGRLWKNEYHRIKGDQFGISNLFIPGSLFINGQRFENLILKYDIYSDELLVPKNPSEIVQLNKEMVDSFSLIFEDTEYNFIKTPKDTLKYFTGYVNLIYKGESALYVKYKKDIAPFVSDLYLGEFYQTKRIYLEKDNVIHQIDNPYEIATIFSKDKSEVRHFTKKNKIRISGKNLQGFKAVLEYCEGKYQ